jgi:hypothetical protein
MKLIKPVFFYILLAELIPRVCYSQNINIYEMQGKWEVVKVTENDKDITTSIDNNAQRWIEFVSDDRYNSDGYPFGRYEGEYHLDEDSGSLVLKSGSTGTKGMKWKVTYDGEYLILKGTGQLGLYKFFLKKTF